MSAPIPRFCGQCGGPLIDRLVDAEQRVRCVCAQCGTIAYNNPQILVNTIVVSDSRVLLCRRAGPPAAGRWGMPGGFMESGETLEEAAAREALEETGVRLEPRELRLHAVVSLPEISQVYVGFLATVAAHTALVCGSECTEVRFFSEADLPWTELAYPDIGVYLRDYFSELRSGAHPIHVGFLDAANAVNKAYRIADVEEAHRPRPAPNTKSD
jgi:ADP-ribose pyrophosphatase YjhB (NUDIX family)